MLRSMGKQSAESVESVKRKFHHGAAGLRLLLRTCVANVGPINYPGVSVPIYQWCN